jgi:hypothetical protein
VKIDTPRRIAHNALIDSLAILARNMYQNKENNEWFKHLKDNLGFYKNLKKAVYEQTLIKPARISENFLEIKLFSKNKLYI